MSPAKAVRLAIKDFNAAFPNYDSVYVEALCEAERQLEDPVRAAAPEMLEMLRRCEMWLSTLHEGRAMQSACKDVIAKAVQA